MFASFVQGFCDETAYITKTTGNCNNRHAVGWMQGETMIFQIGNPSSSDSQLTFNEEGILEPMTPMIRAEPSKWWVLSNRMNGK